MVKRRSEKINTYPYVLYINCRKRRTIVKITITPLNTLRDITQRVFFMWETEDDCGQPVKD